MLKKSSESTTSPLKRIISTSEKYFVPYRHAEYEKNDWFVLHLTIFLVFICLYYDCEIFDGVSTRKMLDLSWPRHYFEMALYNGNPIAICGQESQGRVELFENDRWNMDIQRHRR